MLVAVSAIAGLWRSVAAGQQPLFLSPGVSYAIDEAGYRLEMAGLSALCPLCHPRPRAYVEAAFGFDDFEAAMTRKFWRQLSALVLSEAARGSGGQ